jgi:hypothetical protein
MPENTPAAPIELAEGFILKTFAGINELIFILKT